MKLVSKQTTLGRLEVTPFVGVWIEILEDTASTTQSLVTPFVGVWIEMFSCIHVRQRKSVTPFVGVWIEINTGLRKHYEQGCHSLRGSVD